MSIQPENIRKQYLLNTLSKKEMEEHPLDQLDKWLQEAIEARVVEPTAMALSTASSRGLPSSRMVLLKGLSAKGIVFFTHLESRKAEEILENPFASCLFWWKELERQVIVEGPVKTVSRKEVAAYFSSRPKKSQAAAWVSKQGDVLESRETLEKAHQEFLLAHHEREVKTPPFWGGFIVVPKQMQFWQGRADRLHDRFVYHLEGGKWMCQRVYP